MLRLMSEDIQDKAIGKCPKWIIRFSMSAMQTLWTCTRIIEGFNDVVMLPVTPFGLIFSTLCVPLVKGCLLTPRNRVSRKKASAVVAFFEVDLRVMAYKGLILAVLRNSETKFGKERLCLT